MVRTLPATVAQLADGVPCFAAAPDLPEPEPKPEPEPESPKREREPAKATPSPEPDAQFLSLSETLNAQPASTSTAAMDELAALLDTPPAPAPAPGASRGSPGQEDALSVAGAKAREQQAAAAASKLKREEKKAARLAGDAPLDAMFSEFSAGDSASAQEAADKDDEYEAFLQGNGAPSHCLVLCSRLGYRLILAARVQGFYQGRRNALVIDVDRYSPMSCGPPRPAR